MKCAPEHALSMLKSNSFISKWKHVISVLSPLSLFFLGGSHIFCGQRRADNNERFVPVHYSDICKSELRRTNRRAAKCVENIFFNTKKLQMKIILGKSQIALRKHKSGSNRITASQLKKESALDKLEHAE